MFIGGKERERGILPSNSPLKKKTWALDQSVEKFSVFRSHVGYRMINC